MNSRAAILKNIPKDFDCSQRYERETHTMLKYKNIIFDFGNVIATFDEDYILGKFCDNKEDQEILKKAVFYNWPMLDEGTADYAASIQHAKTLVPERLQENVTDFFQNWHKYLQPIEENWKLIRHLKELGASIYILSNAPTHFADHAGYYDIVKEFDGIVFSAPIVMAKPKPDIYNYLFDTYHLNPADCFFIDDKPENIAAAQSLGMTGYIYKGNTQELKKHLGL